MREEQRGRRCSGAHRDSRDDKTDRKRGIGIDEEHRADGNEPAQRGDQQEGTPDR
jgi:hypothetical protein